MAVASGEHFSPKDINDFVSVIEQLGSILMTWAH